MSKSFYIIAAIVAIIVVGFLLLRGKTPNNGAPSNTDHSITSTQAPVIVQLTAQNNSGENGTASLSEVGGKVIVTLDIGGAPAESQPAHIHSGSCPNPGSVKFPLTSAVNGQSSTVLDTSLEKLKSMLPLAVNVHKSAGDAKTYVACGNITDDALMGKNEMEVVP